MCDGAQPAVLGDGGELDLAARGSVPVRLTVGWLSSSAPRLTVGLSTRSTGRGGPREVDLLGPVARDGAAAHVERVGAQRQPGEGDARRRARAAGLPWKTFTTRPSALRSSASTEPLAPGKTTSAAPKVTEPARVERQVGGGDVLLRDRDDLRLRDVRRAGVRRRDGVAARLERADDVAADLVGHHAGGEVAVLVEDRQELVGERDAVAGDQAADDAGVPGAERVAHRAAGPQQQPPGAVAGHRGLGAEPLVAVGLEAVGAGGDLEPVVALAVGDRLRGDAAVDAGQVDDPVRRRP